MVEVMGPAVGKPEFVTSDALIKELVPTRLLRFCNAKATRMGEARRASAAREAIAVGTSLDR